MYCILVKNANLYLRSTRHRCPHLYLILMNNSVGIFEQKVHPPVHACSPNHGHDSLPKIWILLSTLPVKTWHRFCGLTSRSQLSNWRMEVAFYLSIGLDWKKSIKISLVDYWIYIMFRQTRTHSISRSLKSLHSVVAEWYLNSYYDGYLASIYIKFFIWRLPSTCWPRHILCALLLSQVPAQKTKRIHEHQLFILTYLRQNNNPIYAMVKKTNALYIGVSYAENQTHQTSQKNKNKEGTLVSRSCFSQS